MDKVNEMINKSLEDISNIADGITKSRAEAAEKDALSKALPGQEGEGEPNPDEVAAQEGQEGQEQPNPEEGDDTQADNPDTDADSEGEGDADEDDVEKSLEDRLKDKDNVKKALEVSEFLDELVKGISSVIDSQGEKLSKSIQATSESNELLAKSFAGIVTTQKFVVETIGDLNKSMLDMQAQIKHLEAQPLVRKSLPNAQAAQVVEKSFAHSSGTAPQAQPTTLSKSQVSAKLTAAIDGGNRDLVPDLLAFEGTGDVRSLSAQALNIINTK